MWHLATIIAIHTRSSNRCINLSVFPNYWKGNVKDPEDLSWPEEAVEPRMCQGPLLNLSMSLYKEVEARNFQVMEKMVAYSAQLANEETCTKYSFQLICKQN